MKKVITYGSFDLFHEGHYNLLKRAKALGDYLIVGVTTEQYDEARGKLNVVDSLIDRIDNVRKTGFADLIIVEDHVGQKIEDIQKYDVDIFAIGSDWLGAFDYLKDFCEVVYLERTKGISSTMLREDGESIVSMGIVGNGKIAGRFIPESKRVSGVDVKGVYNPHIESAEKFKEKFELAFATDNFAEFLNEIDAVYIASPHGTHYQYAKQALEAGKHVLCEKPLAFKKEQAEELFSIARSKNLVLFEAIKTAYCPGFNQLINVARSGIIGEIRDVEACFTKLVGEDSRERCDTQYGGSFTELGSYSLLPIVKLLGKDYKEVRFDSILAENGVDLYTKTNFIFENAFATCKNGIGVKTEGQLLIGGTEGYILAKSPWWLTRSFEIRFEDSSKKESYTMKFDGEGLRYELSDFVRVVRGQNERGYKLTSGESIMMAGVMEKFLEKRCYNEKVK